MPRRESALPGRWQGFRLLAASVVVFLFASLGAGAATAAPAATQAAFASSPTAPVIGEVVTLDAGNSTCADEPCTYSWSYDGSGGTSGSRGAGRSLGTGEVVHFTFSRAGTKSIGLTVTDASGETSTIEQNVTVTQAVDNAPVAVFDYMPAAPVTGSPVTFDASGSTCPTAPCTYAWSDDGPDGPGATTWPLGSGQVLSFTFHAQGTKYVRLTITDGSGATWTVEQDVVVSAAGDTTPTLPANTAAPQIVGTPRQGETLTASAGTWTGSPAGYTYAWSDGTQGPTDTLTGADVGQTLTVVVTATNAAGSASARSAGVGPVIGLSAPAPANTGLPTIIGDPQAGQTLSTSSGSWTNSPTGFTYAWQDCNSSGAGCTAISGATASSYALGANDVGHTIESVVTASNAGGSGSASSAATAVVVAQATSSGACDRSATTSTFASQVSAATAGQTVCLASGNYGTWSGTNKAITVMAASGASPTMQISFGSGDSAFTLDGMSSMGGTVSAGASNITIQNSTFSDELDIEGSVSHVVVNHNDFTYAVQSTTSGPNAKIFLDTSGSSPGAAVTIENNNIQNGDLDGVHFGGGSGDLVLSNRFQNLCDRGVNHTDNIQFEGGSQVRIAGNYVYEAQNCPTQGITSYDGDTNGVIIEDNVVDVPRDWGIEFYSDQNSIIRHNTVVYHPKAYSEFNTGDGQIDIDRKSQDPAGTGTHVYDNIASVDYANGSTGTANNNTDPSTVTYMGGAPTPTSAYSDLFLTAG
jgi:hypothetical protein